MKYKSDLEITIDVAFHKLKLYFKEFAIIAAIFLIPIVLLNYLLIENLSALTNTVTSQEIIDSAQSIFTNPIGNSTIDKILPILNRIFPVALGLLIVQFIYSIIITQFVSDSSTFSLIEKENSPVLSSIKRVFSRLLPILLTAFICNIMITLGYLLFIVPGIVLKVYLLLVPLIMVTNDIYYFSSIDLAYKVIKKRVLKVIMPMLVIYVMFHITSSVASILINALSPSLLAKFITNKESLETTILLIDLVVGNLLYFIFIPVINTALFYEFTLAFDSLKMETLGPDHINTVEKENKSFDDVQGKISVADYYKPKIEPEDDEDDE